MSLIIAFVSFITTTIFVTIIIIITIITIIITTRKYCILFQASKIVFQNIGLDLLLLALQPSNH